MKTSSSSPMQEECYDLVIPLEFLNAPAVEALGGHDSSKAEEAKMLNLAHAGRGQCLPLNPRNYRSTRLNKGQEAAVRHVLNSWDKVIMLRGYAGTGKTTAIKEGAQEIERRSGWKVFACASSADASRGTQRVEGFTEAETLEYLLRNDRPHEQLRGGVIWVDEASTIGCRNMVRQFELAERLDARVLLTGDTGQHGSVERGDAFRLLETRAGLESPVMTEIVRQRGEYADGGGRSCQNDDGGQGGGGNHR